MSRGDRWARGSLRSALAAFACLAALGAAQGATFDTVGSLPTGEERFGHNAILLQDGRLALFFGKRGSDSSFSTEVLTYHPTTGEWTAADFDAPPASEARFGATVTMLQNGRILFTGGRGHTGDLATAGDYLHTTVQFDPRASPGSQWTSAGSSPSMAERRIRHTATLLPDGKLLIAGGLGCSAATVPCGPSQASSLASAEIYDPDGGGGATMGSFSPTSSMSSSRFDHAAVLVPATGNVRIFGGFTGALTINASPAVIGTGSQAISYWPLDEGAAGNGISVAQICSSGSAVVTVFEPGVSDEVDVLIPGIGTFPCTITATVAEVATAVSLQSAVLWASTDGTTENPVEGSASTGTDGQGPPSALAGTERYNVGTGIWEAGLSLPDATGMDVVERAAMTATLLPGVPHRIAIVGGTADEISPISSVVVYTAAADLDDSVTVYAEYAAGYQARWQHTANLLPNGQLLVAGGNAAGFTTSSSVQILSFDTVTDQYTVEATEAAVRRTGHTGVILDTGAVVLAGGWVPEFIGAARDTTTTEVYDPSDLTLALEILSVITEPLAASSAILLPNGKVLVAFGDTGGGVTSNGYLFDPATNTWAAAHDHIGGTARRDAPVLPWDDGALVIGGAGPSNALTSVRRFDVASNSWSGLTSLLTARREHTATLLTDGSILVTGGANISDPALSTCEIYYPSADVWAGTGLNMLTARRGHTATLLKDGRVVLFGGFDATGTALNSIEVFEPGFGFTAITPTGTPPAARGRHSAVLLGDGRILVAFGSNGTSSLYSAAIFDPDAEAWSAAASAIETHGPGHKTTLLPSGQVLVVGGADVAVDVMELYRPDLDAWHSASIPPVSTPPWEDPIAVGLGDGRILLAGGRAESGAVLSAAYAFDLGQAPVAGREPSITGLTGSGSAGTADGLGAPGSTFTVTGTQLARFEASGGNSSQHSSAGYPLLRFRRVSDHLTYTLPTTASSWSATSATVALPGAMAAGYYLLQVVSAGVPSDGKIVDIESQASAEVSVVKSDSPDPVIVGQPLTYTIDVTNAGPDVATNVVVKDKLPAGASFSSVTGSGWDCGFETGDVVCTRALLGVTSAPSIILQVHAPLVVGDILNSVSVFTGTDPTPGTDDETTTVAPAPSADLAITKTDGDGTAGWGEPLAYTITVTNAGPDAVAGATVADDFPAALLAVSWDCVASAGSSCTASGTSDISDASVSLAAGGTVIYKATGTVALETPTPLLNTATVAPPAGVADPNLANNTASVDTTVTEPPGIIFYDDFESGDTSAWSSTVGVEPP